MKKNKTMKGFQKKLRREIGRDEAEKIMSSSYIRFQELLDENSGESRELQEHSVKIIYPAIALADTLQSSGWTREKAVSWIYSYFEEDAERDAASMRIMLKIPFAYRLVPGMFLSVQEKDFGTRAGFESKVIVNEKDHIEFHMLKCPYNDLFRKYGYPDLVCCLCHQDDVKNGNMHRKLVWSRKETLGSGGDHCDFSMEIKD